MNKLSVLNRALGFLGAVPVTDPEAPETVPGKILAANFDQAMREVLRRYPWNFIETWGYANKVTAPAYGFTDAYQIPEDCLRILSVGDPDRSTPVQYRLLRQGGDEKRRVIACDNNGANTLPVQYSAFESQLSMWDPLTLKVLAIWLAMDQARAITGQKESVGLLSDLLSEELKDAVGVDGQEQPINQKLYSFVQAERDAANFGSVYPYTNVIGYYDP